VPGAFTGLRLACQRRHKAIRLTLILLFRNPPDASALAKLYWQDLGTDKPGLPAQTTNGIDFTLPNGGSGNL